MLVFFDCFFLSILVVSRHTRCALMRITYLKPRVISKHIGHFAAHISHVDSHPDTRRISSCVKCRPREEHNFHLAAEQSVADCGMRHECGSAESLGRVCEVTQRCKPASAWKEAVRIVELEREKEQLEDDLLACLGKIDQMQKKIDEMTFNENHDAEFIAKVMKERDRVLAEKEQHSEEARKAFERAKGASKRPCDARVQSWRPCADR